MALTARAAVTRRARFSDFSGGLNLRDAPTELDPSESPDCMNVTLDARGGVTKRLGYAKGNSTGQPAALIKTSYFSELLGKTIWQAGAVLYTQASPTAAFSAAAHTWSTSARCGLCDFAGYVYAIHPVDGVIRSTDGATWAAVAAGPDGTALAAWQNKLFAVGDPAQKTRLYACAAGDGTTWSTTNDLRAINDAALTAVAPAPSGGVLAFKGESCYLVYDSTTLAYQVLDATVGAGGPLALTSRYGALFFASQHGIFRTDGQLAKPVPVAERLKPMFGPGFLALAQLDNWAMGWKGDRIYLSLTRTGATANNLALEHHPLLGWTVPHTSAVSCYATYGADDETLLGGAPATNGQVWKLYDAIGTDDGTAITARWQSRWFEPDGLALKYFNRLMVTGRGQPNLYVKLDYSLDQGALHQLDMDPSTGVSVLTWDSGENWDEHQWGPAGYEGSDEAWTLGVGRAISFELSDVGSGTGIAPALLDLSYAPTVGPWAVYEMQLDYVPAGSA